MDPQPGHAASACFAAAIPSLAEIDATGVGISLEISNLPYALIKKAFTGKLAA